MMLHYNRQQQNKNKRQSIKNIVFKNQCTDIHFLLHKCNKIENNKQRKNERKKQKNREL